MTMYEAPDFEQEVNPDDEFDRWMEQLQDFTYQGANNLPPVPAMQVDDEDEAEGSPVVPDEPVAEPVDEPVEQEEDHAPVDPATAQAIYDLGTQLSSPEPEFTPTHLVEEEGEETPPAQPPSYIDPDDEVQMGLWQELQTLRNEVQSTRQVATQTQEQIARQQAEQTFTQALAQFRTQYPTLDDADIALIRPQAAVIVNPLIAQEGPVNGMIRAMYVASLELEATRDKVLGIVKTEDKATTRKRKISSLNSSSGSAPRTNTSRPQYTSDRDVVNQLAKELQESSVNGRFN